MKIYNYCDAQNHNNANFRALKIKSQKKWPKFALENMLNNNEMQKLIDKYESMHVDIIAKHYVQNLESKSVLITLEDSFGNFMGCYSSNIFEYDNFSACFAQRTYHIPSQKIKNKRKDTNSLLRKVMNFVKKLVNF